MILFSQKPFSLSLPRRRVVSASAPVGAADFLLPCGFWLFLAITLAVSVIGGGAHFPFQRWLFLSALAVAAEAFPVTGPRGRRLSIGDGVGLACALLLLPPLAPVPVLLAGGIIGLTGRTRTARRHALARCILTGGLVLVGSLVAHSANAPAAAVVFVILRALFRPWPLALRRRDWKIDMAALVASAPAALLMAALWQTHGLSGAAVGAALMGTLLVFGHFAFESALLREQVQAMERLGAVTLAQDSTARLIERFLQLSGTLVSAARASLWLNDTSQLRLARVARVEARWTAGGRERPQALAAGSAAVRFGEGWVGRVAERQLPLIISDTAKDKRGADAEGEGGPDGSVSILFLPLAIGGEVLGVVQFERDVPQPYTRRDLNRVRALVNQAAVAISNSQQHRAVTSQAVTDSLSGLFNRRHIQVALESEHRRAQRYGHALSVIMLDIDHFKSYNDTYGHVQGDVLIKMVSALLRANVRAVDIVGRFGGEEFIILMPETSKEEAGRTAERLRQAVAGTAFPGFADDPDGAVLKTISLGVATLPDDAPDTAMLVTRADQSLYEAKRGGRNRVVVAESSAARD